MVWPEAGYPENRALGDALARRVAVMRKLLDARAAEQKVVALRALLSPNNTRARAGEAAARMERVEVILKEIARM